MVMHVFDAEGIKFAFPTKMTYFAQDDRSLLSIHVSGDV